MANKIQQEYDASRIYDLKQIQIKDGNHIVELTRDNVARVEAMIRQDSKYSNSHNPHSKTSSTYWLKQLKEVLIDNKSVSAAEYSKIISHCVETIDRENSTRLKTDGVGRVEMAERLCKLDRNVLLQYLKKPKQNKYRLIEILSKATCPKESNKHARRNKSFASKFCHYACMILFKGKKEQDNFSIYDKILRDNIPLYAGQYDIKIPRGFSTSYSKYISVIDQIIKKSGNKISRNGFDHLLWYFHKAQK